MMVEGQPSPGAYTLSLSAGIGNLVWIAFMGPLSLLLCAYGARLFLQRVPTLITSGTRDLLTPPSTARKMHERIAGSELFIVPRATHYIPIEFGDLLAARVDGFLERVGWPAR